MDKCEMLKLLSDKVAICTKCKELSESRTQTVFGDGNPNTKIMFLAEAPGQVEDETGHVLVGPAGKMFTNILTACGINREDVYLCNILKCRPPGNRTPYPAEANNCRPFLDLQIKVINPQIIVCLGAVAAQNLLQTTTKISQLRGQCYDYEAGNVKIKVVCTFHPSYVLRNNNDETKRKVWDDMQLVIKELGA